MIPYYNGYYSNQANMGAVPDALNQFKNPYQAMNPQAFPFPQQNDIIWVLGEVEATSYPVAPNNTVVLWDKNSNTIYIKSVNAHGVPSMRVLDFVERTEKTSTVGEPAESKFVSIEEFKTLELKFDSLNQEILNLKEGINNG